MKVSLLVDAVPAPSEGGKEEPFFLDERSGGKHHDWWIQHGESPLSGGRGLPKHMTNQGYDIRAQASAFFAARCGSGVSEQEIDLPGLFSETSENGPRMR